MIGEVWDQIIRNEECYTRLLKVDELHRLNQRVDELIEQRHPRSIGLTKLIEPRTMAMLLRLVYDRVIFRQRPEGLGLIELRLSEQQLEAFLKEAAGANEEFKRKATEEAEKRFKPEHEKLRKENENLRLRAKQTEQRLELENEGLRLQAKKASEKLRMKDGTRKALLERMAAIIGLTYSELGDGAPLADDEALDRIRELLLDYDDQIVARNYKRGHDEVIRRKSGRRTSHA